MAILKINGVEVKDPKKLKIAILDVDDTAERNAAGTMLIDRIATKRKISLEWPALKTTEISTILQAISEIFFSVTYLDPMEGSIITRIFYAGDRSSPLYTLKDGIALWEGLKFNLIEQ